MGRASATGREVRGTNGKVSSGPASNAQRGPAAGSGGAVGPPPHGAQAERCSWRHRQRQPGGKARVWAGSPPCHCVKSSYHRCLYFRRSGSRIFESVVFSSFPVSPPHLAATRPQAAWATGHRAASDVCRRAAPAGPGAHPLLICVPCRAGTAGHAGPALTSTPRTRCTQSQPTSGCILVVGGHTYDYEEGGAWGE